MVQSANNKSTVWGQDQAGNGGYNSGGDLRVDMGSTTASVKVFDETGADTFGAPVKANLIAWLAIGDAATARGLGAKLVAFNGVKLNDFAVSGTSLTAADKALVTKGVYTAWGYQQMYRRNNITDINSNTFKVDKLIRDNIAANIGSAGVPTADMKVGRETDGGIVGP